jgi:hypothetical protein
MTPINPEQRILTTSAAGNLVCPFITSGHMVTSCKSVFCMAWEPTGEGEGFCRILDSMRHAPISAKIKVVDKP